MNLPLAAHWIFLPLSQ